MKQALSILTLIVTISLNGCMVSGPSASAQGYSIVLYNQQFDDVIAQRAVMVTNIYSCDEQDLSSCNYETKFRGESDQFGIIKIPTNVFDTDVYIHIAGFGIVGPVHVEKGIFRYTYNNEKYEYNLATDKLSFALLPIRPQEKNIFDIVYQHEFKRNENPEEYLPKLQTHNSDPNCPNGETGKYRYSDGSWVLVDCKYTPTDLDKVCISDSECEFNCITTPDDLRFFGCDEILSACTTIQCRGIKGRCGVYGNENGHISQVNRVQVACIR